MKILAAVLALLSSSALADMSDYRESPYIEGSDEGQAHYTIIQQKCGSGCTDCALLFISYNGVRMVERSLSDKVGRDLFPHKKRGGIEDYAHFGVTFDSWDIPRGKLYLTAYGNGSGIQAFERRVAYNLATRKLAFVSE